MTWLNIPCSAGFSFKEERVDSPWVRDLRCPSGPYRTELYVDRVYRKTWRGMANKILDHCSAYREPQPNGKVWSVCCCNAAATYAGYGTCSFINAKLPEYGNWPDGPRTCG